MEQKKLWTRDFTIITLGSVVSMLGNAIAGFAMGLLVLDYSKSTFLYAIYLFLYTFPRIVMPIVSGPFLDKFSRKKTIYMLDFTSAALFLVMAFVIYSGWFSFGVLAVGCVIMGCIDSVYRVAYDSFYPLLISEGNYSKAYSITSILETLTSVMIPVSAILYNMVGIVPLFVINGISFFVAAVMETQIKQKEEYSEVRVNEQYGLKRYKQDFLEGISYLRSEKGLWAITLYFTFSSFAMGASSVISLPYFKANYTHGEYIYICVGGAAMLGRMIGGSIYYKFNWPSDKKYYIALFVYAATCIFEGTYLFTPVKMMVILMLFSGFLGVTSYNIRISATQSYVPDERKGRFNGTFEMMNTFGMMLGELAAGALTILISERLVLSAFMAINLMAAIFVIGRNKKHVEPIYNRQA